MLKLRLAEKIQPENAMSGPPGRKKLYKLHYAHCGSEFLMQGLFIWCDAFVGLGLYWGGNYYRIVVKIRIESVGT